MIDIFQRRDKAAPVFFTLTIILINLIFYATLKVTPTTRSKLNQDAGVFNIFVILFIFSVIKVIKKEPRQLVYSEDKWARYLEQFYESEIYANRQEGSYEDVLFNQFLSTKNLRFCKTCGTFKVF